MIFCKNALSSKWINFPLFMDLYYFIFMKKHCLSFYKLLIDLYISFDVKSRKTFQIYCFFTSFLAFSLLKVKRFTSFAIYFENTWILWNHVKKFWSQVCLCFTQWKVWTREETLTKTLLTKTGTLKKLIYQAIKNCTM